MEESIQGNGRTGAVMAKDSTNKKVGRCILEDSKMGRNMEGASYTNEQDRKYFAIYKNRLLLVKEQC